MDSTLPDPFVSNRRWGQQPPAVNLTNNERRHLGHDQINPPRFRLETVGPEPTAMEELTRLRYRNIELETELRLTKQQVYQAHSGTQYLVNTFASQQAQGFGRAMNQNSALLEDQNQQLRTECHRLRGQLEFSQRSTHVGSVCPWNDDSGWGKSSDRGEDDDRVVVLEKKVLELKEQRVSLLNDVLHLLKEDPHDYSFEFDDGDPARYKPLEHFQKAARESEKHETPLLDLDPAEATENATNLVLDGQDVKQECVDTPQASSSLILKKPSYYVKPGDFAMLNLDQEELSHYERHAAKQTTLTGPRIDSLKKTSHTQVHDAVLPHSRVANANRSSFGYSLRQQRPSTPPYRYGDHRYGGPRSFAQFEHDHLMANATFIEDMDPEQYLEFWESLEVEVRRFAGRHSKEEWRAYYDEVVRPKFLERMGRVHGAVAKVDDEAERTTEGTTPEDDVLVTGHEQTFTATQPKTIDYPIHASDEKHGAKPPGTNFVTTDVKAGVSEAQKSDEAVPVEAMGLEASRRAVQILPKNPVPVTAPRGESESQQTTGLAGQDATNSKSRPPDDQEVGVITPTDPTFGSFESASALKPVARSILLEKALPGLGQVWRRPAPRQTTEFARTFSTTGVPRDCHPCALLFSGVERKAKKHFVLGKTKSLLRSVVITGIPFGTTLAQVLDKVKGGNIVGAKYFDTAGLKTVPPVTTNTVFVEFLRSQGAKDFVDFCAECAITFQGGDKLGSIRAEVQLIPTHTRPISPVMLSDMLRAEGTLTRVLFIVFASSEQALAPEEIAREISSFAGKANFRDLPRRPVATSTAEDGMLLLEYADVQQAAAAWNAVGALERKIGEVSKGFAADPCGVPLDYDCETKDVSKSKEMSDSEVGKGDGAGESDPISTVQENDKAEAEAERRARLVEG